ncbi:MAG TPA: hypothetical protein VK582_25700 [Pyrinomonadaceae bacterium]|nr:hypothetical protein [Pyrinomonadaceae bacterium]
MTWRKVTIAAEQNISAEPLAEITNGFSALLGQRTPPSGTGLFTQKRNSQDLSFTVYFSPACIDYCPAFLEQIQAEACDEPTASDVHLLLGNPDAGDLLNG